VTPHYQYILKKLRPHRKRIITAVIAMLGIMLIDLGSPLVVAVLIDNVVSQNQWRLLTPLMLAMIALPFLAAICRFASNYTVTLLGQRVVFDIRLELYRKVQRLHCRYMHGTTVGKLMERLRGDVAQLQTLLTQQAPQLLVQLITGLVMIAIMLVMSVQLTIVVLAGVGLYILNYRVMVPRIRKIQRRYRRKLERLSGQAQERLSGAIVVKSFGRERDEARDFVKRNFAAERVYHRFREHSAQYQRMSQLATFITYSTVIGYGTYLVIQGSATFGMVTAFTAFTWRLLIPAGMLAELSNQLQQAKVALERIFELMDAEKDVANPGGEQLSQFTGEVVFDDVRFHYEQHKPVLRGLDLTVKPGQNVALVGQTGCGKSTIINLLYRYYDVISGSVRIDGVDIRDLDTAWYRHHLAMVPQEPIVLDTTVAENIAYGRPEATREEIQRAARMAELTPVLDRLEGGLDALLGDRGAKLSVGEKQRLCIARAILADPKILILDEATSSLDTHSEALIQRALTRVMRGRTSFIVAHRLSTIVNADLIVVLDQGRVLEAGNHAQLMAVENGRYRHLYQTQTASQPKAEAV
jgi:ABC-type multidrug transport system fused ATPase/permease subunit